MNFVNDPNYIVDIRREIAYRLNNSNVIFTYRKEGKLTSHQATLELLMVHEYIQFFFLWHHF